MLIQLQDICKIYMMGEVEVQALCDVNLEIAEGELTAIMGPSGSGKSTLMNIVGCLDQSTRGSYFFDGVNVSKLGENELARIRNRKLGFVFQNYNLLRRTPAIENVELPLIYAGTPNRRAKAKETLAQVGLADRIHHRPNELSGGEQQRVAIARALINDPDIILADEPTGNLDSKTGLEIIALFQRLNRERGITIIYVTHSLETAEYTRRIVTLRDGRIISDEPVAEPLLAPAAVQREEAGVT